MSEDMRNLHVPLPQGLYERLRRESRRTGQPGTALVREAVEVWLTARERAQLHEEIARYARDSAGSVDDLDSELESAAIDVLGDGAEPGDDS